MFETSTPCPVTAGSPKNPVPIYLVASFRYWKVVGRSSSNTLFSRLNSPSSSSFLPWDRCPRVPVIFVDLLRACSRKSTPLTSWSLFFSCSPGYSWLSGHQCMSPVHAQNPQALLVRAALNPFISLPWIPGITPTYMQDFALALVENHEILMGRPFELIQVPLNGIPSFGHVSHVTQLGVICKFAVCTYTAYVIDEWGKSHTSQLKQPVTGKQDALHPLSQRIGRRTLWTICLVHGNITEQFLLEEVLRHTEDRQAIQGNMAPRGKPFLVYVWKPFILFLESFAKVGSSPILTFLIPFLHN